MASKRFRGKRCVYCGREGASDTGDHIIARGFFLPSERADRRVGCDVGAGSRCQYSSAAMAWSSALAYRAVGTSSARRRTSVPASTDDQFCASSSVAMGEYSDEVELTKPVNRAGERLRSVQLRLGRQTSIRRPPPASYEGKTLGRQLSALTTSRRVQQSCVACKPAWVDEGTRGQRVGSRRPAR